MSSEPPTIRFPQMRELALHALDLLSDYDHQVRVWRDRIEPPIGAWDSLDNVIHILYDDTEVLLDPTSTVGAVLRSSEVDSMQALDRVFGPIIDELGAVRSDAYLAHDQWPAVMSAAAQALAACEAD